MYIIYEFNLECHAVIFFQVRNSHSYAKGRRKKCEGVCPACGKLGVEFGLVDVFRSHIEGFFLNKRALVIAVMGCQGGGDCVPLSYFCSRCF